MDIFQDLIHVPQGRMVVFRTAMQAYGLAQQGGSPVKFRRVIGICQGKAGKIKVESIIRIVLEALLINYVAG